MTRGPAFRLPDQRGRLDIVDDRVLGIGAVVGGIEDMRLSPIRRAPARGRIERRDALRRDRRRRTGGRVAERLQIFRGGAAGVRLRGPALGRDPILAVGARLDQRGVDPEGFAPRQTLGDGARRHGLAQPPEPVALAEPAAAVRREGRRVGRRVGQVEPAESAAGQVQARLLGEAPLGADAEAGADPAAPGSSARDRSRACRSRRRKARACGGGPRGRRSGRSRG